jgi:hypothetical protein
MKKAFIITLLLSLALSGCTPAVRHTVSNSFRLSNPYTIAILPVDWPMGPDDPAIGQGDDVGRLLRIMTFEKLEVMNYKPLALEEVDEKLPPAAPKPVEIADLTGADAVLYTSIIEWKGDIVVRYAYLKVAARFELYSRDGKLLWRAEHEAKESDIRLEKKTLEMAVLKAYEPSVQRFIDVVFSTLPIGTARAEEKTFFEWLP